MKEVTMDTSCALGYTLVHTDEYGPCALHVP